LVTAIWARSDRTMLFCLDELVSRHLCLPGAEQGHGLIDATLPGVSALGSGDVVGVISRHAVGKLAEKCAGLFIGRERGGEVGGQDHLLRDGRVARPGGRSRRGPSPPALVCDEQSLTRELA